MSTVLKRWNPASELETMQREIGRLFGNFTPRGTKNEEYESAVWSPVADIVEDANNYTIAFDMPGIEKKDIKINIADNTLSISGERKYTDEKKDATMHRIERSYGKFYRSFGFPASVVTDKINASFKDGVLTVTVPKAEEAKPKQIEIK